MKKIEVIEAVFVILHYKNVKDTLECISSIKKIRKNNYKILVVDNNSGNESDIKRIKKVVDDVIVSKTNLGFANGNNLGIDFAKKKYHPDFLIVINNDTLIIDSSIIDKIKSTYNLYHFDALGFKILTNGGDSVNPFPVYDTLEKVNNAISKSEMLLNIYHSKCKRFLLKYFLKFKHLILKPKHLKNSELFLEDVALHGCAIVFSKQYYEKYNDCFYKGTFLYHEEEFLDYRRRTDHLKFVYDPNIRIFHKEGSSLNYNYNKKIYDKLIFREEQVLQSLYLLKTVMQKQEKI